MKRVMVHKWVLAARSPVFAALEYTRILFISFCSEEEIESIHLAVDCTVYGMNQFIQFIYTGEVKGLVNHRTDAISCQI